MRHPAEWYGGREAVRIAENVLLYQLATGGWQKNIDMTLPLTTRERDSLRASKKSPGSTLDNNATTTQIRYLARVYARTHDLRFADAAIRGFDYLLEAQYPNGGWPQYYPLVPGYYTHITYNDDAMANVLNLLYDLAHGAPEYAFVDGARREAAVRAVEKGIDCILRTQVRQNGVLTAWCAQHDEVTLAPAKARAYELPSLSGKESVGIVRFLMRLQDPSAAVVAAIQSAVRWLDRSRINGIRVVEEPDPTAPHGTNKVVFNDSTAPPLWGRFYDLATNAVFFCSRDGVPRTNLADISNERRNHYGWLGDWPQELLDRDYPAWQKRWALHENVLTIKGAAK
jgi:PelA/Pel-15E family pectate lyase